MCWHLYHTEFVEHLRKRGLKPWYNVAVDCQQELVTFNLFNGSVYVGYQRYNWKGMKKRDNGIGGRYYTYIMPEYKLSTFWGEHDIFGYGPIFVVESVWNAIRIKNCYYDAVAVLSATPHKQIRWRIKHLYYGRPIVAVVDNDENGVGDKLGKWCDYTFKLDSKYGDINDMTDDEAMVWLTQKIKENQLNATTK